MTKSYAISFGLVFVSFAFAAQPALADCRDGNYSSPNSNYSIASLQTRDGDCDLQINWQGAIGTRTFGFEFLRNNGVISYTSAISYNSQPKTETYFVLPAPGHITVDNSEPVRVRTSAGLVVTFNSDMQPVSISSSTGPCRFVHNKAAEYSDRDYVLKSCPGKIVIDSGLAHQASGYMNVSNSSTIYDPNGRSCLVQNSHLYKKVGADDARLVSQSQLLSVLRATPTCAELDLAPLASNPKGNSGS